MKNKDFKAQLLKRSYKLSLQIIKVSEKVSQKRSLISLGDQLLRAGTSIGANIVEAQGSSSRREFKKYLQIAFKSSWETGYWLGLFRDANLLSVKELDSVLKEVLELNKILGSIILTLKGKKTLNSLN